MNKYTLKLIFNIDKHKEIKKKNVLSVEKKKNIKSFLMNM